jgi:hypothetical protein
VKTRCGAILRPAGIHFCVRAAARALALDPGRQRSRHTVRALRAGPRYNGPEWHKGAALARR